jgi:phenylacetate-CoA ligase
MSSELMRAFSLTLAKTEWLSPQKLRTYQLPLIARLLRHARETTEFYKDRLDFDLASSAEIERCWSQIPVISRAEAVENRDKLRSNAIPPETGPVHHEETSGSSGMPFPYEKSHLSAVAARCLTERGFRWWGLDGNKAMALVTYDKNNIGPPPHGRLSKGWHSEHPEGRYYFLTIAADIDIQVRWLLLHRPDYLLSNSTILRELALTAQKQKLELDFTTLLSVGTMVDETTRALCRSAFGAEIADTYGGQEVDHVASQCRECGEYHVSAESCFVEILRNDGSPAACGESGRVIVTPLYNYAMPLVRYEMGDAAQVGAAVASCGRGLPNLRRIVGRYRNMFRFRSGRVVWPDLANFHLREWIPLKQLQLIQLDLDTIEIRYVPLGTDVAIDIAGLTDHIRSVVREAVVLKLQPVERIDRSPTGKFEDCVSLVGAA